jgi:hypothetical protein
LLFVYYTVQNTFIKFYMCYNLINDN